MDRISVFYPAKTATGYIQAVITEESYPHFAALGFASSVNEMKEPQDVSALLSQHKDQLAAAADLLVSKDVEIIRLTNQLNASGGPTDANLADSNQAPPPATGDDKHDAKQEPAPEQGEKEEKTATKTKR